MPFFASRQLKFDRQRRFSLTVFHSLCSFLSRALDRIDDELWARYRPPLVRQCASSWIEKENFLVGRCSKWMDEGNGRWGLAGSETVSVRRWGWSDLKLKFRNFFFFLNLISFKSLSILSTFRYIHLHDFRFHFCQHSNFIFQFLNSNVTHLILNLLPQITTHFSYE